MEADSPARGGSGYWILLSAAAEQTATLNFPHFCSADIIAAPLPSPRELLDALFRELDAPVNDSDCSALR